MSRSKPEGTSKNLIYRELRRSIIMGHRNPGERLDLEALARNYGTSITPVRDALELREILELASIKRAAVRINEQQLEQLEHVHAGYTGEDDESYDRYMDENRRFHYLIAEASGNQELAETVGHLHDRLARFMVLPRTGETLEPRHARLIEALRTRDPAIARQAILDEINETREDILERVIQNEGASWRLGARTRQATFNRSRAVHHSSAIPS